MNMTESSRSRVTVSVGRGRKVVRRAGGGLDGSDEQSTSLIGTKRSLRERLGEDAGSSLSLSGTLNCKRQRGDISSSSRGYNGMSGMHIGQEDLRLKLMRKNESRQSSTDLREKLESRQSSTDLREKLDRTAHSSTKVPDTQWHMPDRKDSTYMARIPPSSVINELPRADPSGSSSYAYRSTDFGHIRQRSPERMAASVRGLSPTRNREHMQRVPRMRSLDDARSVSFMRKDLLEPPRPVGTNAVYVSSPPRPTTNSRPLQSVFGQLPPPQAAVVQRNLENRHVDGQQTVDGLLQALGLGKYAILFKAEEVDMTALKQMGESDLKEIGIPMGPRKKILLALAPSSKRQQ